MLNGSWRWHTRMARQRCDSDGGRVAGSKVNGELTHEHAMRHSSSTLHTVHTYLSSCCGSNRVDMNSIAPTLKSNINNERKKKLLSRRENKNQSTSEYVWVGRTFTTDKLLCNVQLLGKCNVMDKCGAYFFIANI